MTANENISKYLMRGLLRDVIVESCGLLCSEIRKYIDYKCRYGAIKIHKQLIKT